MPFSFKFVEVENLWNELWATVEVSHSYLCFLQYEGCVLHWKWKKKTTAVQNRNIWKPRCSHQFQRTGTPCWEWEVMALELITKYCNLRDKNLSPELHNTINTFHTLGLKKPWACKQQNQQKLISKRGWKSPEPVFTWKPLVLITANVLLENTNSRFSFCCGLRAVKYIMDLTLHGGLTKILLNSSRDLNRIYSGAFRCAEEEVCCFPVSQGWGQAVELTAVLEATGLRIQSIALGGTLWKWLEGFGNTSLGCQLLRRFIFRCWFAAPTPRVLQGASSVSFSQTLEGLCLHSTDKQTALSHWHITVCF